MRDAWNYPKYDGDYVPDTDATANICLTCTKPQCRPEGCRSYREMMKKLKNDNAEHCVACGAIIPEGRQVCPRCKK